MATPAAAVIEDYDSDSHQFQSPFTYLSNLRDEFSDPDFDRVSEGLRGLVNRDIVPEEDFAALEPLEVPGLPYDFGDGSSLRDATALLTSDRLENSQSEFIMTPSNSASMFS